MQEDSGPLLLAVDLGVKTGLALYDRAGRLLWHRSRNYGSAARLKRAVSGVVRQLPGLTHIVMEGGGPLADVWAREAERHALVVIGVAAEEWRKELLLQRDRRTGRDAKQSAGTLARLIIEWSGLSQPKTLRHDAAEAILVGYWAVQRIGWLSRAGGVSR